MPKFVNPYNFVRSEYDSNKTAPPLPHDRLHVGQYTGRIVCTLQTFTRVTSKSFEETASGQDRNLIYGSSLKGLFRSVAETVACACYAVGDDRSRCQSVKRLCICCRIFGWMPKGNADVHLGRVQIGDARPLNGPPHISQTFIENQALSNPKERHNAFYRLNGNPRGRKFYYHHSPEGVVNGLTNNPRDARGRGNDRIYVVSAGELFSFQVDFADLTAPELGLLLYALQLEDGLFHKFGKGKPLGFGSIKITVETIGLLPRDRYEQWDSRLTPMEELPETILLPAGREAARRGTTSAEGGDSVAWKDATPEQKRVRFIAMVIESFFITQFGKHYDERLDLTHMSDLHHMLSRHEDYLIHYPSKSWFVSHPNKGLPTLEDIEGNAPGDRSGWLEE